jgi:hypothetical protein
MKSFGKTIGSKVLWCGRSFRQFCLSSVDFHYADLCNIDLVNACLHDLNLRGTNLRGTNLRGANLSGANLRGANLSGANLYGTSLRDADLSDANLRGANLNGANLRGAKLTGANLTNTCLDPEAPIPELTDKEILDAGLEIRGDLVYGWRTRVSQHVGSTEYEVGKEYQAPWFSVCQKTECHPGLYLASREWLWDNYGFTHNEVHCYCRRDELVHVGDKWRAKRLWIVEDNA